MRILIIGASGLVGRHVVEALNGSHEVIALGRQELDLASDWSPADLPGRVDAIVHVAQARRWREFPQFAGQTIAINLTSTGRLLEYATSTGVRSLVYASTGGVYRPGTTMLDESSPLKAPQECDLYVATKLASEQLIASYSSVLDSSILRLFTVHGRGEDPNTLFPRLRDSILHGRPITLAGGDGPLLRPTHASEVARVISACLNSPANRVLNVGGTHVQSLRAVATRMGTELGVTPAFTTTPEPATVLAPSRSWAAAIDVIAHGSDR